LGTIKDLFSSTPRQKIADIEQPTPDHKARFNNIVARHWRGEFPLWIAYWIFGFAGNIVVALIPVTTFATFNTDKGYEPFSIFFAITVASIGVLLVLTWQMVGVWKSATLYMARTDIGKKAFWGGLAKLAVVVGFIRLLGTLTGEIFPQLSEIYRIAFYDDPDIPAYSIRLMRDGTEAEIVGGFKYGLAKDLSIVIKAASRLKVVHFDSIGGRIGEGEKLFKLIRERGLNTYVSTKCLSACTLAFAGGRERFILRGA
jgi:hypothetical protein